MPAPKLTADATLYRSAGGYANVASLLASLNPCDRDYADCVAQAQIALDQRIYVCSIAPLSWVDADACRRQAQAAFTARTADCQARLVCHPDQCGQSPVAPYNRRCCPPGTQACGAGLPNCVPDCPPRKRIVINDASCTCVCDPLLQQCELTSAGVQKIRDPNTCQCVCPQPCPPSYLQDPVTCECACPSGFDPCPRGCVRLGTNTDCSGCDDACGPFQQCCNGVCTGINTDTHCGDCYTDCTASGRTCCRTGPNSFACVDTATDRAHCGGCGQSCGKSKFVCLGGHCVCPSGTTPCGANDCCGTGETCCHTKYLDYCAALQSDPRNCGACGRACGPGQTCCSGICVNLQSDEANCGKCGTVCGPGQLCCDGVCRNVQTDPQNCGGCGFRCSDFGPAAYTCVNGKCRCPSNLGVVDHTFDGHEYCCEAGRPLALDHPDGHKICCPTDRTVPVTYADGIRGCCSTTHPVPVTFVDGISGCCLAAQPVPVIAADGSHFCCDPGTTGVVLENGQWRCRVPP